MSSNRLQGNIMMNLLNTLSEVTRQFFNIGMKAQRKYILRKKNDRIFVKPKCNHIIDKLNKLDVYHTWGDKE